LYESLLDGTDIEAVTVGDYGAPDLIDFTSEWISWFVTHDTAAILILPSYEILGAVTTLAKVPDLVRAYRHRTESRTPSAIERNRRSASSDENFHSSSGFP